MLSRLSVYSEKMALEDDDDDEVIMGAVTLQEAVSKQDLASATKEDMDLGKVQSYMNGEWPEKRKDVEERLRAYYELKESLGEKEGMLYLDGNRIVVPTEVRGKLIRLARGGHPGTGATKRCLKELCWWP